MAKTLPIGAGRRPLELDGVFGPLVLRVPFCAGYRSPLRAPDGTVDRAPRAWRRIIIAGLSELKRGFKKHCAQCVLDQTEIPDGRQAPQQPQPAQE
jgi:hypothetical protein